ncbi:MAG: transglutaminase domain-containing protein [Lachnospiraceae bacterium]|nr:transglutaminase domain-containing protein [Lachnospiraceae bacterium]
MRHCYLAKSKSYKVLIPALVLFTLLTLSGCHKEIPPSQRETEVKLEGDAEAWSNDWTILMPELNEDKVYGNEYVSLDTSNCGDGYIYVKYTGENEKVKLQIYSDTSITYTYNIKPGVDTVIPLSLGSGLYSITAYENIQDTEYAMVYAEELEVTLNDELSPFLYPNQYVMFNEQSDTTALAKQLTNDCATELDAVGKVYDYMVKNITYDYDRAENVQPGYLPDVDEILSIKTGICFDYSAVMAAMLRSVGIPTRMEIGYSGDAYHAWVSVYTKDHGWINDIIQFDGVEWTLMDPTFDANSADSKKSGFSQLIGGGGGKKARYTVMYNY